MKIARHFKTITYHRWLVMKGCFSIGLYWQGLCHDLSKYSPAEFFPGARFYQGDQSPNNVEREWRGYSQAWLHHKGRNKHHYEYWVDYSTENIPGGMAPVPMPVRYILEMMMDRIAASKVYARGEYSQGSPLIYYRRGRGRANLHPKTRGILELLLQLLDKEGEREMVRFIRREILPRRKEWDDKEGWRGLTEHFRQRYGLPPLSGKEPGRQAH